MRPRRHLYAVLPALIALLAYRSAFAAPAPPADPCQSPNVAKQSVPISPAASGILVPLIPASSQTIHICGLVIDGANFFFAYGGTDPASTDNCLVNPVVLTGMFTSGGASNDGIHAYSGPGSIFSVIPANNAFCINATSPVAGVITYTQP